MSFYKDLLAQREELDKKIESAKEAELAAVIQDINQKIHDYNLTAAELRFSRGKVRKARAQGGAIPAKYRNPVTGESWSGRGKAPKWIADKERKQFLIQR